MGIAVGDYIDPLVIPPGAQSGHRVVMRVTHKRALLRFLAVDAAGREHDVWPMDDPRLADEDQVAAFKVAEAARSGELAEQITGPAAARDTLSIEQREQESVTRLIERVRELVTQPSTPITWEADHCNIISDYPRPVMLEAIKRLLGEPQPRTADPLMDAVADVVAASKPISEVPIHEMWHARQPIERYVLATVDIPGGQVFAGLGYERGELVAGKREHLIGIVSVHASRDAVGGDPVTVGSADDLSQRIERDLSLTFSDRAWFVEVWNEREALTQTYAPWGRPRTR